MAIQIAPRAIAVVQRVDAEFFKEVLSQDAMRLLRQLADFPLTERDHRLDDHLGRV